jgi:hypothetical protein
MGLRGLVQGELYFFYNVDDVRTSQEALVSLHCLLRG